MTSKSTVTHVARILRAIAGCSACCLVAGEVLGQAPDSRPSGVGPVPPGTSPPVAASPVAGPAASKPTVASTAAKHRLLPESPRLAWHYPDYPYSRFGPPVFRGMVYVGGKQLEALNPRTGRASYTAEIGGPWGPPAIYEDIVIARHESGLTYAFSFTLDKILWSERGYGDVHPTLARCGDGGIAVWSADGVIRVNPTNGDRLWCFDDGRSPALLPVADDRRVYRCTDDGEVIALDAKTGKVRWRKELRPRLRWNSVSVDHGRLFLADRGVGRRIHAAHFGKQVDVARGDRGGALWSLDVATGDVVWARVFNATGFSTPFSFRRGDHNFVLGGFGRSVARFDWATGAVDPSAVISTGANAFGSPSVVGDAVVFGNLDGKLYVHELAAPHGLRWAFAPDDVDVRQKNGRRIQVGAFTFDDGRLFVGTSNGLFGLTNDPDGKPPPAGTVIGG